MRTRICEKEEAKELLSESELSGYEGRVTKADEESQKLLHEIESKVHHKNILELNGFEKVVDTRPYFQPTYKERWVKWHESGALSEIKIRQCGSLILDLDLAELEILMEYLKGEGK